MGSEVLLEQVQLNFSFRNKFIILPCDLLEDNNTFSKMRVFRSRTGSNCDDNCTSHDCLSGTYEISGRLVFVEQSVHEFDNKL